ncbi:MAG: 6,7-dimethyl-8-ribityllumazine synthase [Acidimicrobiia bacterium]
MTPRVIEGHADGSGVRVGIAVSTFNGSITSALLDGALAELARCGAEDVTVIEVPGALELPVAAKALVAAGCEAVVAVGAVIEGETDHYRVVVRESAAGLTAVALQTGVPVGNAVLTVRELEQAVERSSPGPGNKGAEAARAALVTVQALRTLAR